MMGENGLSVHSDQIIDLLVELMSRKWHLMSGVPEEMIRYRERLDTLRLTDGSRRVAEGDLFFRTGVILSRHGEPLPMGELSKALTVPLSTGTRIVDALVESGYAERVADPEDRRVVRVALTEEGRELYRIMSRHIRQRIDHVLRRFTSDERDQLVLLLRKAVGALEEDE